MKTINLTPDPRILRMLGQIELKGWQCIAELIDNSVDAMLKYSSEGNRKIEINIPTRAEIARNVPLYIKDTGIGMTAEELENCLKAGYTSQSTDNLGLFGMGFNIATARLGDVVEVWTSTKEMTRDIGVRIDLIDMQRTKNFERELLTRNKTFDVSGTSIEISKFHPRAEKLLNRTHIQKELNRIYSKRLLDDYGISITTNGTTLDPFQFCVWSSERYVEYEGQKIYAIQKFDHKFDSRYYCSRCFIWVDEYQHELQTNSVCPNCHEADQLKPREIGLHGWVGIQRYNDLDHYGINIIRNGRIIKKLDKSLFIWQDRYNRNNGEPIKDYPIDTTTQGGRIVGEIIADFITPTYTKDSFEETDKHWLDCVEVVRGKSPLQPRIAEKLNFSKNQSPLARLFYGYRKSHPPGLRNLIPGNKNGQGLYIEAKRWADLFYTGDPEYQTDEKWYEAVLAAEFLEDDDGGADPTDGNDKSKEEEGGNKTEEGEDPYEELYPGKKTFIKSEVYDLKPMLNEMPYELDIFHYWPTADFNSPIILEAQKASKFKVYINNHHPLFREFADGWDDLILMEISTRYYEKLNDLDKWPVTRIYYELKNRYLRTKMLDVQGLVATAKGFVTDLQNYLVNEYGEIELNSLPRLSIDEVKTLKQNYLQIEMKGLPNVSEATKTASFLKYMDFGYVIEFAKQFPQFLYDGKYFSLPFESIDEEEIRNRQLDQYNGYFNDIKWFVYDLANYTDVLVQKKKNIIIRNRYSLEFLNEHVA